MKLSELLAGQPPVRKIPDARASIRKQLAASGKRLVVIDDDPTGIQTIYDVNVYFSWSVEVLRQAISNRDPVFFISTNSRSLNPDQARAVSLEVGHNLLQAAQDEKVEILLASRSDSTLRGHFPCELEALTSGLELKPDGVILIPAFFEAGRFTVNDIQWVEGAGEVVPAHLTEFANDPVFGFKNSDLKAWVSEKTSGLVKAENVQSISLHLLLEGGPQVAARKLMQASHGEYIVANAACYEDLEILALAVSRAEASGKKFVYRCSASFIKARGGFQDRPLLNGRDAGAGRGPGLVIVGSYVEKTSRQLKQLLDSNLAQGIELNVERILNEDSRTKEIASAAARLNQNIAAGMTTILYTSRTVRRDSAQNFLEQGSKIIEFLCDVVRQITIIPGFVVVKGGSTSYEMAKQALEVEEAWDLGQISQGVPVIRLGQKSRWPGIPYVIFPGNVGEEDALLKVVITIGGEL